eukprot:SAG31_NODE_12066_length_971_cov_3.919725_1_plen_64_part_10
MVADGQLVGVADRAPKCFMITSNLTKMIKAFTRAMDDDVVLDWDGNQRHRVNEVHCSARELDTT